MRLIRTLGLGLLSALALLAGLVLWMAGGVQSPRTLTPAIVQLDDLSQVDASGDGEVLRVVVWNIAWGYGWGSEGSGTKRPASHFDTAVDRIAATLRNARADVVLLQEIDFDATRSYGRNQALALARATGLPYVAEAESWRANWVPFPYWPPSEHFGQMSSGGAILSRYPLSEHYVDLLPKPADNAFHYNLFYLFRYAQGAQVATPLGEVQLVNVHLEAFDPSNRVRQAKLIYERLSQADTALTLLAGDFNTIPPEAPNQGPFSDEPEVTFASDDTLAVLRQIPGLRDAVAPDTHRRSPSAYYTFPAHAPTRALDHALVGSAFEVREVRVLREAGDVSDHLPVLVELTRRQTR